MSIEIQSPDSALSDAQTRLMRMLESVRLEKVQEAPGTDSRPHKEGCPHCGSVEPWGDSSWCPSCGYYPKLGKAITPVEMEAAGGDDDGAGARRSPLAWLGWLCLGCLLIVAESVTVMLLLPEAAERGSWGRMQLAFGAAVLMVGQVRAFLIASQNTDALPLSAFFFDPFRIWAAVLRMLPGSRPTLYCGCWGGLAAFLAVAVIGLDFEGMFAGARGKRPKVNPLQAMVKAVSATQGSAFSTGGDEEPDEEQAGGGTTGPGPAAQSPTDAKSFEGSLHSLAGSAGADSLSPGGASSDAAGKTADAASEKSSSAKKPPVRKIPLTDDGEERVDQGDFVIFGYLTNSSGELRSLLLAEVQEGRGRFICKLSLDNADPAVCDQLQEKLDEIRSPRAALRTPYHARWVRPLISCRVAYRGRTPEGLLDETYLVSIDESQAAELKAQNGAASVIR